MQRLATITWYSRQAPQRVVRLYQDKVTYYRRPTLGYDFTPIATQPQPLARQGQGHNTARRIAAFAALKAVHDPHETLQTELYWRALREALAR